MENLNAIKIKYEEVRKKEAENKLSEVFGFLFNKYINNEKKNEEKNNVYQKN